LRAKTLLNSSQGLKPWAEGYSPFGAGKTPLFFR
jgi:hypothetical protein